MIYWTITYWQELFKMHSIIFQLFQCSRAARSNCMKAIVTGNLLIIILNIVQVNESIITGVLSLSVVSVFYPLLENKKDIILVVFSHILISVIDIIIGGAVCLLIDYNISRVLANQFFSILLNSISIVLLLILEAIIHFIGDNRTRVQKNMGRGMGRNMFFLAIGLMALAMYIVPIQSLSLLEDDERLKNFSLIGVTISGIVFLFIGIVTLANIYIKEKYRRDNQLYKELIRQQKSYYESILEHEEQTKKFRHDFKNHLACIGSYIESEDYIEAKRYLESILGEARFSKEIITGSRILDIVLNDVWREAKDIKLEWRGGFPEKTRIQDLDICILFSNLFKNAITATNESEKEKKIEVKVKTFRNSIFIEIQNPVDYTVIFKNGRPVTTKPNKARSGFGMVNIEEIVHKYNGSIDYEVNDQFVIKIILENVKI